MNEAVKNGIIFRYSDENKWTAEVINEMEEAYNTNFQKIVEYMFHNGLSEAYLGINADAIRSSLGNATIELDLERISYFEHKLDSEHVFSLEYSGKFEKLFYFSIDG